MSHQTDCAGASLDTVRDALQAAGHLIRPRGADAFMASCPLHDDRSPSLSVNWRPATYAGHGGAVLLHCFSCGADAADLAGALGLRVADLFDAPLPEPKREAARRTRPTHRKPAVGSPATPGPLPPRITAEHHEDNHQWRRVWVYTYTDLRGRAVQQVIRQECSCTGQLHKRFQQRYRVERQWVYRKPEGFAPTLYQPAAIRTAKTTGNWVWIAEGEKDADTLTRAGRLATTNPQGAANFPTQLIDQFQDLNVAIVADRDLSGYRRAVALAAQLRGTAARVVVLLAALEADKADLTDHVEAGLWEPAQQLGGLLEVTADDLHALTLAAQATQAEDRFTIAVTEAAAHQARRETHPGSDLAASRWRGEADRQRGVVDDLHQQLQHHAHQHPTATAHHTEAVTAILACIQDTYRSLASNAAASEGTTELKESA